MRAFPSEGWMSRALFSSVSAAARVVDLHLHSNASDGCDPPRRVIERAWAAGLKAAALTDHDTVAGLAEARAEAERLGIEFIEGVELSSSHEGRLVHILGHFIRPDAPALAAQADFYHWDRCERMGRMLGRLREMGVGIDAEDFLCVYGGASSIGRGQLGAYLVEKGLAASREEAFQNLIGEGGPAYVSLRFITPFEAVRIIREAGGAATMAHPGLSASDEIIPALTEAGLAGIEVEHPSQDDAARARYREMASGLGLLCMGGSDCHGARPGPERMGRHNQPLRLLEELKGRLGRSAEP